jgi:putative component of toxin-antitoxin plasmid stabilization module
MMQEQILYEAQTGILVPKEFKEEFEKELERLLPEYGLGDGYKQGVLKKFVQNNNGYWIKYDDLINLYNEVFEIRSNGSSERQLSPAAKALRKILERYYYQDGVYIPKESVDRSRLRFSPGITSQSGTISASVGVGLITPYYSLESTVGFSNNGSDLAMKYGDRGVGEVSIGTTIGDNPGVSVGINSLNFSFNNKGLYASLGPVKWDRGISLSPLPKSPLELVPAVISGIQEVNSKEPNDFIEGASLFLQGIVNGIFGGIAEFADEIRYLFSGPTKYNQEELLLRVFQAIHSANKGNFRESEHIIQSIKNSDNVNPFIKAYLMLVELEHWEKRVRLFSSLTTALDFIFNGHMPGQIRSQIEEYKKFFLDNQSNFGNLKEDEQKKEKYIIGMFLFLLEGFNKLSQRQKLDADKDVQLRSVVSYLSSSYESFSDLGDYPYLVSLLLNLDQMLGGGVITNPNAICLILIDQSNESNKLNEKYKTAFQQLRYDIVGLSTFFYGLYSDQEIIHRVQLEYGFSDFIRPIGIKTTLQRIKEKREALKQKLEASKQIQLEVMKLIEQGNFEDAKKKLESIEEMQMFDSPGYRSIYWIWLYLKFSKSSLDENRINEIKHEIYQAIGWDIRQISNINDPNIDKQKFSDQLQAFLQYVAPPPVTKVTTSQINTNEINITVETLKKARLIALGKDESLPKEDLDKIIKSLQEKSGGDLEKAFLMYGEKGKILYENYLTMQKIYRSIDGWKYLAAMVMLSSNKD